MNNSGNIEEARNYLNNFFNNEQLNNKKKNELDNYRVYLYRNIWVKSQFIKQPNINPSDIYNFKK